MLDIRDHGGVLGGLSGGLKIKSIQRGTLSLASGSFSQTVTISSVDLSKSIVRVNGYRAQVSLTGDVGQIFVRARLSSNTQIAFTRNGSSTPQLFVEWEVIEFENATIQTGDLSVGSSSTTGVANVSATSTSKTLLFFTTEFNSTAALYHTNVFTGRITSSTQVTFTRSEAAGAATIRWYLVEFK